MGKAAVIFPGQGAQTVGMGRDVAEAGDPARAIFDRANEVLGFDIKGLCFEGPAEKLAQTDIQQPAIFITSVALWEAFKEAGGKLDWFTWTGGLSLGEYTALHVAGAMGFDEALRLVHRRGQLMQQASEAAPSGMVSLIGADEAMANALCDKARGEDILAPANFNCPGQIVISGSKPACDRAVELTSEFGCKGIALVVAGAFHSPFMAPAGDGLWPVLEETPFTEPAIAVIANVNADRHGDADAMRESLRRQVTEAVLWQRCIERMISEGVDRFVEVGPGRSLTGMMRKIDRKKTAINISTQESIASALDKLAGA